MKRTFAIIILFGLFSLLITFPHTPIFSVKNPIDQSVYQYVGNRILEGSVPYSDAWDHKQPLIYFIYAGAAFLTGKTIWGIWLIEFICLWSTGVLSFSLLTKFCPKFPSTICILVALFTISNMMGISNPEQLALPFYVLSLLLFYQLNSKKTISRSSKIYSFFIGVSFACCFFLKQSLISIPVAICLYYLGKILIQKKWSLLRNFLYIAVGFILISLVILGYLFFHKALSDYWNAAFVFNFLYSNTGLMEKINAVFDQLEIISTIPTLITAFGLWIGFLIGLFIAWIPGFFSVMKNHFVKSSTIVLGVAIIIFIIIFQRITRDSSFGILQITGLILGSIIVIIGLLGSYIKPQSDNQHLVSFKQWNDELLSYHGLIEISVLSFPLVLFFISISGEHYHYYNITFYPTVILIFGIFLSLISKYLEKQNQKLLLNITVAGLAVAFIYNPTISLIQQYKTKPSIESENAIAYISQTTKPNDSIYVWGMEPWIYNVTQRQSPSRYFYQSAAVNWESYEHQFSVVQEILSSFHEDPPKLFIVTDGIDLGKTKSDCTKTAELMTYKKDLIDFVCQNYQYNQTFGNIQVYQLIE